MVVWSWHRSHVSLDELLKTRFFCRVPGRVHTPRSCGSKGVCPYVPLTGSIPSCVTEHGYVGPDQSSYPSRASAVFLPACRTFAQGGRGKLLCIQGFPPFKALMQLGQWLPTLQGHCGRYNLQGRACGSVPFPKWPYRTCPVCEGCSRSSWLGNLGSRILGTVAKSPSATQHGVLRWHRQCLCRHLQCAGC